MTVYPDYDPSEKHILKFQHIAYVVSNGRVLAEGKNEIGNMAFGLNVHTIHAEMAALKKLKKRRRHKYYVVVVRYCNGVLRNSKPCSLCKHIMINHGIKYVYYSTDDGNIVKERVKDLNTIISSGTNLVAHCPKIKKILHGS